MSSGRASWRSWGLIFKDEWSVEGWGRRADQAGGVRDVLLGAWRSSVSPENCRCCSAQKYFLSISWGPGAVWCWGHGLDKLGTSLLLGSQGGCCYTQNPVREVMEK